jgi:hypothetical protein
MDSGLAVGDPRGTVVVGVSFDHLNGLRPGPNLAEILCDEPLEVEASAGLFHGLYA